MAIETDEETAIVNSVPNGSNRYYDPSGSTKQRAINIIEEERISLDPKMQSWTVKGSTCKKYCVEPFNNGAQCPTCSCAATSTCCHIMAAMIFINYVWQLKKQPNTTTMIKNQLKAADKRSGRKKPRVDDTNNNLTRKRRLSHVNDDLGIMEELLTGGTI
ncbi:hypothetical protein OUZ56_016633 [Daphnia magna]|uniref:SWIM-type domain-containing protein n=1 Tax=Daphnia magna TaxID=35525 RepID=A0ABR0AR51_9CRUS|nr:hypothetical protein OUZ56_016633 [Daphnia magna]